MTGVYWGLEFVKVLLIYTAVMFVWPGVVFYKFLKGKSFFFRFAFCAAGSVLLINTAVLLLGLIHILNPWVICALFYGTFVIGFLRVVKLKREQKETLKRVLTGTYGIKTLVHNYRVKISRGISNSVRKVWRKTYGNRMEILLVTIVIAYGMIYFCYGAFQDYSYGFGDMYPHHSWIYGLTQGKIFSAGVYPEGMHCFIYLLHTVSGIRLYSIMLFVAGIQSGVLLLSVYIFFREVFVWKYSPIIALTLFLTVDQVCVDEIYSMSRLQWTIPQEFAFYSIFLCAAFLLRYLKKEPDYAREQKGSGMLRKCLWNEELLIFALALSVSLAIHFYATIMAFFLCLAFVPVNFLRIFQKGRFPALVIAVLAGVFVAVLPMGGALASGIKFQGSIGWAVSVIEGTEGTTSFETIEKPEIEGEWDGMDGIPGMDKSEAETPGWTVVELHENMTPEELDEILNRDKPEWLRKQEKMTFADKVKNYISHCGKEIYSSAYVTLFQKKRADLFLWMSALAVIIWLAGRTVQVLKKRGDRLETQINTGLFDEYLSLVLASVVYMVLYGANSIGLPAIIAPSRLCSISQLLLLAVCTILFDFAMVNLLEAGKKNVGSIVAAVGVLIVYVGTKLLGCFHGYLYYELTRYNAAVMVTQSITERLPAYSFTIVSTADELYQQIGYGPHEELISFLNGSGSEDYTLPTKYVFLYVEKKPLEYAQSHFFAGPSWLAEEKYPGYYSFSVSQCPEISSSQISKEEAARLTGKLPQVSLLYSNLDSRTLLESSLYEWCREFEKMYPNELHTYYEDENFVCYYFQQNPNKLYQLGIR